MSALIAIFLPGPVDPDVAESIAVKLEQHIATKRLYRRVIDSGTATSLAVDRGSPAPSPAKPAPLCPDCDSEWGQCATHRRACESCGRADVALHSGNVSKKLGMHGVPLAEKWCAKCDPLPEADPWDLASEELILTADLPRETPAYWGRDRGEFDPCDDKSDLQPFTKTGKP